MSTMQTTSPRTRRAAASAALTALLAAALVLLLTGCARVYTDYSAFVTDPHQLVSANEYRIAPPDVVQIRSKRVREIAGYSERVSPDGTMNLPLLGSVFVAGKTQQELAHDLEGMARAYYQDADVSVHVVGYHSQKIFVFGEVASPGPYSYTGANTLLRLMAQAQPTRLADPAKVQVLRPNRDGRLIKRMTVDLNRMVMQGDMTLNTMLEDGDVIYVPANPLAAVGLTMQQLLLPIRPMAETVRGPKDIDDAASAYGNSTNDQ
jgi:polysaccharide export outer membrane protein